MRTMWRIRADMRIQGYDLPEELGRPRIGVITRWIGTSDSNWSRFGPEKRFSSVPEPSNYPTRSDMVGQTRIRTGQPTGFARFG